MEIIKKKIKSISFSLISPEQIKRIGATKIVTSELYDMEGYPVDGGLMDLRLGAIDPGVRCRSCGGRVKECIGHFGYIELARPVIHVKYVELIDLFLKTTCSECNRILLSEADFKLPLKEKIKKAKEAKKCPWCGAKKEKIILTKPTTFYEAKNRIFPIEIRARLEKISDDDIKLFGINPAAVRPEWAVLTLLLVPPVTARPSITLETGERSEDDLTHKLGDIVRANQRLWENLNAGAPEVIIEDLWDLLQYHVTTFFDNSIPQIPPARHRSGQPLKTITERIKGKEGRIRYNLAGKRVNYSSRSVISPDPFIAINEIGIPREVAKIVTVAETVNSVNIERMKELVLREEWPAANYIIRPDGKRKRVTSELRQELAAELAPGYIVERHLQDGDILLFGRYPSLHKMSLMAHYAKILDGRTFRLHPVTTFPYNADFDGDEMNIHSMQTEEARAEAAVLLDVKTQLMTPKNNTNVLGCIADGITGNYILCNSEIAAEDAAQLLAEANEIKKVGRKKLKGTELFSFFLPSVSFETKTKNCLGEDCPYYKKGAPNPYANCKKTSCPYNSYLEIKKGKIVSGVIDKNTFGVEDGALVKLIDKEIGREEAISVLQKVFCIGAMYLSRRGFTISLEDLKVGEAVKAATAEIIKEAEKKVGMIIESYNAKTLQELPGKTREETREIKILQVLNEIRSKIGDLVKRELPRDNPAYTMILSGAGGNIIYITQIACSVGQQALWGGRIALGYSDRTLSFFKKNDVNPKAKGFIYSSFFEGLKPHEFFFGAMTGRDSLMDTALRTPKSGYLYRRLANALQDLRVEYDGTVRDSAYNIIQFCYGEDGNDVSNLHLNKKIEPGEAIGIITAQSFGEPATQMTLNVFHFAGIAEMQITLGLPRLIEIFDARKKPSTPTMEIVLEEEYNNEEDAKAIAEKIKAIKLEDLAKKIIVNFTEKKIEIELDKDSMRETKISPSFIQEKLAEKNIIARMHEGRITIKTKIDMTYEEIYKLKENLKKIIIRGIRGIEQVMLVKRKDKNVIITAGSNLSEVMKIPGVNKKKVRTNDIYEIANVLGIEAARQAIIEEINNVVQKQGLDINERHIKLIADSMTFDGEIKGFTRAGIIEKKISVLAKASFETPIKHFILASLTGQKDELASIIENIIVNQPVPVGTGLPGLLVKIIK